MRGRPLFPCVLTVWLAQVWRGPIGKVVPRLLSEEAGGEGRSCVVSSPSYLAPSFPAPPQPGGTFLSSLLGWGLLRPLDGLCISPQSLGLAERFTLQWVRTSPGAGECDQAQLPQTAFGWAPKADLTHSCIRLHYNHL